MMKSFVTTFASIAVAATTSLAGVTLSGTAMQSSFPGVTAGTSVGVLISLDSGSDWSNITQVAPGTAFTTGSRVTVNSTTFTVFGRNTATALRSVPGNAANFSFTGGMSGNDQFAILLFPNAAEADSVTAGTSLSLWRAPSWLLPATDDSGSTFTFGATGTYSTVPNTGTPTQSFSVVHKPAPSPTPTPTPTPAPSPTPTPAPSPNPTPTPTPSPIPKPTVFTTLSSIQGFNAQRGRPSAPRAFAVSGSRLTANVTVRAPAGYQISRSKGRNYTNQLQLTRSKSGAVARTKIFVRLAASSKLGARSGNIRISSAKAISRTISVRGRVRK